MDRIDGIFLALEPIAVDIGKDDLGKAVFPVEGFVIRQQRCRVGPHISPEKPRHGLHLVGLDFDLPTQFALGIDGIFIRLVNAVAVLVPQPAMVIAAQPAFLDITVGQIGAAVRAVTVDEPVGAAQILVKGQILAQKPDRLGTRVFQLGLGGERVPIAAQQFAHGFSRAHFH